VVLCTNWQDGGQGAIELGKAVTNLCEKHTSDFKLFLGLKVRMKDQNFGECCRTVRKESLRNKRQPIN